MGKHSGEPVEETPLPSPPRRRRLLGLGAAILATVVVWGVLVSRAIHFGSLGKRGDGSAWLFCALATIGAIACLFTALILVVRLMSARNSEPVPVSGGGKRAAR